MMRMILAGAACLACLLTVTVATARALMIAPPPVPMRLAAATVAYNGKVTEVSEKAVPANMYKGDMRQMKIATFRVSETLVGKGAREVKVAFILPMEAPIGGGRPIRPPIGGGRFTGPQLAINQEGVLLLNKHPSMKDVYVLSDMFGFINKTGNPGFDGELSQMKAAAKVLASPMTALKAKSANERFQAAALLVTRYRSQPGPEAKTEKVPAAESKLILEAIAGADWNNRGDTPFQTNPINLFSSLGIGPKDGFNRPRNLAEFPAAAKKWLEENAGKYEMTRFVRETGVSEEPGPSIK